jgi:stress response protein YsnF
MKTIIAAFCDTPSAQQAVDFLHSKGVSDVQFLSHQDGNLLNRLTALDVPDERAQLYAEVMRRGAPLLVAQTDHDARSIARELDKMGSLDLDAAQRRWKKEGWNGYDASALPYDAAACADEQAYLRQETVRAGDDSRALDRDLDVIEEQVSIGKRPVQRGGVRVRTFIVERPVSEQVQLREERIDVSREAVNEPVTPSAADATFTEEEFVVTAQGEEAVVGKEARVVERVHVGKVADTRTETIEETERRRDVEVQQVEGQQVDDDTRIRRH